MFCKSPFYASHTAIFMFFSPKKMFCLGNLYVGDLKTLYIILLQKWKLLLNDDKEKYQVKKEFPNYLFQPPYFINEKIKFQKA